MSRPAQHITSSPRQVVLYTIGGILERNVDVVENRVLDEALHVLSTPNSRLGHTVCPSSLEEHTESESAHLSCVTNMFSPRMFVARERQR